MSGRHDVDPACFASSIGLKQREAWQTVISLLREGDELKLVWIGGNDNGYLRAASGDAGGKDIEGREYSNPFSGLHHDEVWLRVYRKGKKKYGSSGGSVG